MNFVLSLFPGIGLLDMAFEEEGFTVVRGPDVLWGGDIIRFHPPAGKFDGVIGGPPCQAFSSLAHLVRANGHEPRFGNLIPEFERCVAEASPAWFVMENVPAAPEPSVPGYGAKGFLLDNSAILGDGGFGLEQRRVRRITFGLRGRDDVPSLMRWIDLAVFFLPDASRAKPITASHDSLENLDSLGKEKKNRVRRSAQLASLRETPVAIGGSGKVKRTALAGCHPSTRENVRYKFGDALRLQGLPGDFLKDAPFTAEGKLKAVANGVPIPMGRAIARAVKEALQ